MSMKYNLLTQCTAFRITGWPKKLAHSLVHINFICLNFIKYWPIFKLISLSESGEQL